MENKKINLAELLKDCPIGMKLYSPIFGNVFLDKIRPHLAIVVTTDKEQGNIKEEFLYDGRYGINGECMLFPSKNKTTWEGFVPPCKFKVGDIVCLERYGDKVLAIFKGIENNYLHTYTYTSTDTICFSVSSFNIVDIKDLRFASLEEKEKLFEELEHHGYRWNLKTKTLEKLVEPKFKVGDIIQSKTNNDDKFTITNISDKFYQDCQYCRDGEFLISIEKQDDWELVPNKFDITTLKPFDKVLVRDFYHEKWNINFFSCIGNAKMFKTMAGIYNQCIPYEGNEHLLGTTDACDEFYKTWRLL